MNITGKKPLGLKKAKPSKDKNYLQWLREQPCCVCSRFGEIQHSPTQAHHCIHDRFGTEKRPDREAIPLCEGHHQGLWDRTKIALHQNPRRWRETYGPDWSYVQLIETDNSPSEPTEA